MLLENAVLPVPQGLTAFLLVPVSSTSSNYYPRFGLQDTHESRISSANLSAREDGQAVLWQTTRGLWSDLTVSATLPLIHNDN